MEGMSHPDGGYYSASAACSSSTSRNPGAAGERPVANAFRRAVPDRSRLRSNTTASTCSRAASSHWRHRRPTKRASARQRKRRNVSDRANSTQHVSRGRHGTGKIHPQIYADQLTEFAQHLLIYGEERSRRHGCRRNRTKRRRKRADDPAVPGFDVRHPEDCRIDLPATSRNVSSRPSPTTTVNAETERVHRSSSRRRRRSRPS